MLCRPQFKLLALVMMAVEKEKIKCHHRQKGEKSQIIFHTQDFFLQRIEGTDAQEAMKK